MIKLDIINEVVNKTGITKTKAELAVETVFGSMKRSLANCADSAYSMSGRAKPESGATRAPAPKFPFRRAKLCASNPARNCSPSTEVNFSGTMEIRA